MQALEKIPAALLRDIRNYLRAYTELSTLKVELPALSNQLNRLRALGGPKMAETLKVRLAEKEAELPAKREALSTGLRAFLATQGLKTGETVTLGHLAVKFNHDLEARLESATKTLKITGFRVLDSDNSAWPPLSIEGFEVDPATGKRSKTTLTCYYEAGQKVAPFQAPAKKRPAAKKAPASSNRAVPAKKAKTLAPQ